MTTLHRLIRDERGISSIEFVIVATVFFMLIFGMIDFSRAMWEWNAAAKATHKGVRFAVVNDVVAEQIDDLRTTLTGFNAGDTIPSGTAGTGPFVCTWATGCNGDPAMLKSAEFLGIVAEMKQRYDRIEAANVIITYEHIGLGFFGNPLGPVIDPVVTVSLQNMQFDFVTPGLAGIFNITMPDFSASLTGEDHNST